MCIPVVMSEAIKSTSNLSTIAQDGEIVNKAFTAWQGNDMSVLLEHTERQRSCLHHHAPVPAPVVFIVHLVPFSVIHVVKSVVIVLLLQLPRSQYPLDIIRLTPMGHFMLTMMGVPFFVPILEFAKKGITVQGVSDTHAKRDIMVMKRDWRVAYVPGSALQASIVRRTQPSLTPDLAGKVLLPTVLKAQVTHCPPR